jgi:glycosyltransferase involved in cell wall biosynthesis
MSRRPDRVVRAYRRARAWERAIPSLSTILVGSSFVADQLVAAGARPGNVKIVPLPIAPSDQLAVATGSGVDVVFVGRLTASKGADVLLHALARMPGVTAAIAGDGPERAELEALARSLGLGGRVRFVGWISPTERRELFAAAGVFAFPSVWQEPFGMVGLEALAQRLPVVASEVGGIPSWLVDGEGGLLVPPDDPVELAGALGRVLEEDDLRRRLAETGPEVAARFSIERHLELLLPELEHG